MLHFFYLCYQADPECACIVTLRCVLISVSWTLIIRSYRLIHWSHTFCNCSKLSTYCITFLLLLWFVIIFFQELIIFMSALILLSTLVICRLKYSFLTNIFVIKNNILLTICTHLPNFIIMDIISKYSL